MRHFLMSLTFGGILWRNAFFRVSFRKIAYFRTKTNFFTSVLCLGAGRGKRGHEAQAPPPPPPQASCRPGCSGTHSPTWSSRFDSATHSGRSCYFLNVLKLYSGLFFLVLPFHCLYSYTLYVLASVKCDLSRSRKRKGVWSSLTRRGPWRRSPRTPSRPSPRITAWNHQ